MLPFLAAHRAKVTLSFGAAFVGMVLTALTPLVQRTIVDRVILTNAEPLAPWLTLLVALGLIRFGLAFVRRYAGGRVSLDVAFDLRNSIFDQVQRLDFAHHDQLSTGQLVARSSSDVGLVQQLLALLPLMSANVLNFVVSLVVMIFLSPLLALVVALVIPGIFVMTSRMRLTMFPASLEVQERAGNLAGVVDEAVAGVRVVKGFGQEAREIERFGHAASELYEAKMRSAALQARYQPALQLLPVLGQVGVLALGGWLVMEDRISVGTFVAFFSYLVQLVAPARMFAVLLTVTQQARAGCERILELLDSTPLVQDRPGALAAPELSDGITFDGVTFGYMRSEPVLKDFTWRVPKGSTVALVGTSGSGKSTVGLLLPRFYDAQAGSVRLDGSDVRDLTIKSLRDQIGVVFEESFLFSDTVRANIAYGRPDATDREVEMAARAAGAHDFIMAVPGGYDAIVGERGLTLSGGQRQRIALARALITDPSILILDDATSAVDARTEEEIHSTLRRLMQGRTTILVAHRRSTLRLADRIAVMADGRVRDEGTHDELVARCPSYLELIGGDADDAEGGTGAQAPGRRPEIPEEPTGGAVLVPASGVAPTSASQVTALTRHTTDGLTLRGLVRPYMRPLAQSLSLVTASALATLVGPVLIKTATDRGIGKGALDVVLTAAGVFGVVALLDWWGSYVQTRLTARTAERLLLELRVRVFTHLQALSLDFYEREMAGRIMTRLTGDIEALSTLLQGGLVNAVVNVATLVGVTVFLFAMNPQLAAVTMLVIPPLLLATLLFKRRSDGIYSLARARIAAVNANFQESLSGVRVSQAFGSERRHMQDFREVAGAHLDTQVEAQLLHSLYFPFVELLSVLGVAIVLGAGSGLVQRGAASTGELLAFLLYLGYLFSPIQQLSQVFDTYQQARAAMTKLGELLDTSTKTPNSPEAMTPTRLAGQLRFENVRFRYDGAETDALADVNFSVEPGEIIALVGETGAGKSTIVKLVARFHDPTAGSILVDGIPVEKLDLSAYRQQLGYVPQEPFLFSGTIHDNIAYARPDATDLEVARAARAVGADSLVASLPGGYRHVVSERGRSLSAGQRQMIALARAYLADPAVLLLDEATSSLDLATEARVNRAMSLVAQGRTTILIAHRLPTARRADRILVVHDGRVVEEGRHEDLVNARGRYAAMWTAFTEDGFSGVRRAAG